MKRSPEFSPVTIKERVRALLLVVAMCLGFAAAVVGLVSCAIKIL